MAADPTNPLSFILNGTPATVAEPDPRQTLLDYLRSPEVGLTGAKASCGEGGCGACTVLLARYEPGRPRTEGWGNIVAEDDAGVVIERPVNACLTPLCSLGGAAITTIEGLSDEHGTPHCIALRIAAKNGSQCGYCSPGWVMTGRHGRQCRSSRLWMLLLRPLQLEGNSTKTSLRIALRHRRIVI